MTKITACIFILLFASSAAVCQNHVEDSLTQILKTTKSDTAEVNVLNTLSENLRINGELDKAMSFADKAIALAIKLNFQKGVAIVRNNMGHIYAMQGNRSMAMENYLKALKISDEIGFKRGAANSYNAIAANYFGESNYPEAVKNYQAELKNEIEIGEKRRIADTYNWIGNSYEKQGNYPEALKNYLSSLRINEEGGFKKSNADVYNNIGIIYSDMGNDTEALRNYSMSLKIAEETNYQAAIANAYNDIGILYSNKGNYQEAVKNQLAALTIREKLGGKLNMSNMVASYINLGDLSVRFKKFEEAKKYLNKSLVISESIDYKMGMAASYITLGELSIRAQKPVEAKEYLNKGLQLAKKSGVKELVKDCYSDLAELDSVTGDLKGAIQHLRQYDEMKGSILNEESNKQISQFKIQYETEKKDKEIAVLNIENKIKTTEVEKQKIIIYVAVLFAILLILMAILAFNTVRIRNEARQLTRANELRQRISTDLHDEIGAGLTSISMLCEKGKADIKKGAADELAWFDKISGQSRNVSDKLNEVVWATNPENDNLPSLVSYMRNYVSKFFEDSSIRYSLQLPDEIPNLFLKPDVSRNLFFVLKEALNNSVKHSQASLVEILFQLDEEKNYLLRVDDNGKGIDFDSLPAHRNGFGTMRRRIEAIDGKFEISSEVGEGTHVKVSGSFF